VIPGCYSVPARATVIHGCYSVSARATVIPGRCIDLCVFSGLLLSVTCASDSGAQHDVLVSSTSCSRSSQQGENFVRD
jgi:hypothetical protein